MIILFSYCYRLPHEGAVTETYIFSSALSRLVEETWERYVVPCSGAGWSGEGREGEGGSHTQLCGRAGLELTGLMRRSTENAARTLCQVT